MMRNAVRKIHEIGKLKHVGIAALDIDGAIEFYENTMTSKVTPKKVFPNHLLRSGNRYDLDHVTNSCKQFY